MVVFGQSGLIWLNWLYLGKVVVFEQSGSFSAIRLYSGKSGCIRVKLLYSGKNGCNRAKVVFFGRNWLYSGKVIVFVQKLL